jgi:uncharacterized HAD superfamily protein/adenine/guanine phosphoribosyltransferase-like PRPP-binding protein
MQRVEEFIRNHARLLKVARIVDQARTRARKTLVLPHYIEVITIPRAAALTEQWLEKLPSDFDVIIGIPRSGLLIANIIATKFALPLSTPDDFVRGVQWQSKYTLHTPEINNRVLLVEDSVVSGRRLSEALAQLQLHFPRLQIEVASLFVAPRAVNKVNHYYVIEKPPYLFEWNLLTSTHSFGKLCTDMDGVLCKDCPVDVDKDETAYEAWLKTVRPHLIPRFKIEAIVTSRLEKYRGLTEEWLRQHDVKYNQLLMMDLNRKEDKTFDATVHHKTVCIRRIKPFWYWESNVDEAIEIHKDTELPVLCTDRMIILGRARWFLH